MKAKIHFINILFLVIGMIYYVNAQESKLSKQTTTIIESGIRENVKSNTEETQKIPDKTNILISSEVVPNQPAADGQTQSAPTGAAETSIPEAGISDGQENPRAVDSEVQQNAAPAETAPVQTAVDSQTTTSEAVSTEPSEPLQNQNAAQPETAGINNNGNLKAQTNVSVTDSSLGFGMEPFALYGFFAPKGGFGTRYKSGDLFAGGISVSRYSLFGVSSFAAFSYSSIETKHDARYVDAKMTLSAFLFGLNGEFKRPLFSVIRIHRWMGDQYYVGLRASAGVTRVSFTSDTHTTPLTDTVATYNGTLCAGIEYFFGLRAGVFGGYQYIATAGTPLTGVFAGAEVGWRF